MKKLLNEIYCNFKSHKIFYNWLIVIFEADLTKSYEITYHNFTNCFGKPCWRPK